MKNLLFIEQFSSISGGQRVLLNILKGINKNIYTPYVILPKIGELSVELDKLGIKYFILPIGNYSSGRKNILDLIFYLMRSILLIILCFQIIRKHRINLIYANAPRTFFWTTIAARLSGVPIIWHLHSMLSGWELKFIKLVAKIGVAKIIAVSRAVENSLVGIEAPIEVVYNGVNIREKIEGQPNDMIVAYIGQLVKWKGIEDFILSVVSVLKQCPEVKIWVIGDVFFGGVNEQNYKNHLRNLVNKYGLEDDIIFLGKRSDVPELLSKISVLVVPSIEPDPCPLIMLEAMAAGKPVIASRHGGPVEVIKHGDDGLLFKPGDINDLSRQIISLLENKELANKLGRAAHKKIRNEYYLAGFQAKVEQLINETIDT